MNKTIEEKVKLVYDLLYEMIGRHPACNLTHKGNEFEWYVDAAVQCTLTVKPETIEVFNQDTNTWEEAADKIEKKPCRICETRLHYAMLGDHIGEKFYPNYDGETVAVNYCPNCGRKL